MTDPKTVLYISLLLSYALVACKGKAPPRDLVRLEAFHCSKPKQASCTDLPRGARIPRDSLPPADEAFQVWAWHPGRGKVLYRIQWQSPFFANDSAAPVASREAESVVPDAGDSSTLTYNFAEATKTRYVLRVLLEAPNGKIQDQDSLVWDFTGLASNAPPAHHHED